MSLWSAISCIPCRKEMPALERMWRRIKSSGGIVLGVKMQDENTAIELFLSKAPVSFPILLDPDGAVAQHWGVVGIPTTFILDTTGRIAYKATGIREWDSDSIIEKVMQLIRGVTKREASTIDPASRTGSSRQ